MANTIRSQNDLLNIFADNTQGLITAQDMRDLIVTAYTLRGSWVNVDDLEYGAKGDGVTNDTVAINTALSSGKNVRFSFGKTYLVSGTLSVPSGLYIDLNGATLKRANQVYTTLTSTLNSGISNPVVTVASTSGFNVGDTISFRAGGSIVAANLLSGGNSFVSPTFIISDPTGNGSGASGTLSVSAGVCTSFNFSSTGSGYIWGIPIITDSAGTGAVGIVRNINSTDESSSAHQITQIIDNNNIKIANTVNAIWNSGAIVYRCGYVFDLNGNNRLIGPGTIDGNRSNFNVSYWGSTDAIRINSNGVGSVIQDIEIRNEPGEGIVCFGSYNSIVDCYIHDLNGNGIHFTNSPSHVVCQRNRVVNPNGNGSVNHADGGIIWSDNITDATVTECFVQNSPLAGIGSIDSSGNSDCTISNNTIRNCNLLAIGINPGNAGDTPGRIVLNGNRIYSSGPLTIQQSNASPTAYPNRVTVTSNYVDSSSQVLGSYQHGIQITQARYITLSSNVLESTNTSTNYGVYITNSKHVSVNSCVVNGYNYSVRILNSSCEDISINGNVFTNFHTNGVNGATGQGQGISITNNTIDGDSTVTSANAGIVAGDAYNIIGNSIYTTAGATSIGISVLGSNNNVQANLIRGASGFPKTGINVAASTTNNVVNANSITSNCPTPLNFGTSSINNTSQSGNYVVV